MEASRQSPFYATLGGGFSYINTTFDARYEGETYKLNIDNDLYPIVRLGRRFSPRWSMELGMRLDFYTGSLDQTSSGNSVKPRSFSMVLGPVYHMNTYDVRKMGNLQPFFLVNLNWGFTDPDLDYPVKSFGPDFGLDIAGGVLWNRFDLRLGYRYLFLDCGRTLQGVNLDDTDDWLNLSGFFLEVAYRFDLH